ncbi:MAG: 2-hydroxychromene-2-carboxylate isomerase [Myxococcales bacterium]|nr:2-hydroxychromene-2-carboxylate isomerase [Myxococcales bacterium]
MRPGGPASKEPIYFFFDFLSPYAYLAWHSVHDVAARVGRDIEPIPVLLAALLDAHGQKGPAEIPAKRAYVFKDALRTAHGLDLPFVPPPAHPYNPLLALRVATIGLPTRLRRDVMNALFHAAWGNGQGLDGEAAVAKALEPTGLDADVLIAEAKTPAIKEQLRADTATAVQLGVFGVPTFLAGREVFWGHDSLGHLSHYLAGADPATTGYGARLVQNWLRTPAAATRRTTPRSEAEPS